MFAVDRAALPRRWCQSGIGGTQHAGAFYEKQKDKLRNLTSKLRNEDRDEDRPAAAGFESRKDRLRHFVAQLCMQAFALLTAAAAYKKITGQEWIPYSANNKEPGSLQRKAAAAQMAAFAD